MNRTAARSFAYTLLGMLWLTSSCYAKQVTPVDAPLQASEEALPLVSVQLWSVKDDLKEDFKGTLVALAEMGFDGVELFGEEFGEFTEDPDGFKVFLEQNNLEVSGAHVHFKQLSPDVFDAAVAFYQAIGCDKLIVAMDARAWDPNGVHELVEDLNLLAEKLAPHNMSIGYHNHAEEFGDYQDSTYWDHIASSTSESVILQLDVGWVAYAGKNPAEYVRRYPGRTVATHYKIRTPSNVKNLIPIIGQDSIDWAGLLSANIEVGGTRWLVVEQEEYPGGMTPLQAVKASKAGLDGYLARHKAP